MEEHTHGPYMIPFDYPLSVFRKVLIRTVFLFVLLGEFPVWPEDWGGERQRDW
jgi:hypothetical protein